MATQKEIDASTQAEALLNSDVFKDAVKNLTAEYIAKWINSDVESENNTKIENAILNKAKKLKLQSS